MTQHEPINIDIIARTRNRRCAHLNRESQIHEQLIDSTFTQKSVTKSGPG